MHPLDLVKTRLQIQPGKAVSRDDPKYYSGVFDCLRKMYRYEGITSYWKGIVPPILAETPKRAVKVCNTTTLFGANYIKFSIVVFHIRAIQAIIFVWIADSHTFSEYVPVLEPHNAFFKYHY